MINVQEAVNGLPHFDKLCSVERLYGLIDRLRTDPNFEIEIAGKSVNDMPIHHVRFGTGSVKALFVAFPHCMEPVGGLTVYGLLTLLQQRSQALLDADVEWHIVPCIDPDGAMQNEGWSQQPFTPDNLMRNFYLQAVQDQADLSFPASYKSLKLEREPSKEGRVLKKILDQVRPDFYFDLHSHFFGGAFFYPSRDLGASCYQRIYQLLKELDFPIQKRPAHSQLAHFGEGIVEVPFVKKLYDHLEQTVPSPENHIRCAASFDYLQQIKPDALTFVAEVGFVRHPDDESERVTGQNLRRFKLRMEADCKYLATALLEEWENVKDDVDTKHLFYQMAIPGHQGTPKSEKLMDGGAPMLELPTRDILFNPQYARMMTEGDRFNSCMFGPFIFLCRSYPFVRLLKDSPQTPVVRRAVERLERAYDEILDEIKSHVDFSSFELVELDTLAKVQLGSGLIVLNALLEERQLVTRRKTA